MPDNNTTNDENKNLETMDNTELLEYLWRGLNKANIGGIFTINADSEINSKQFSFLKFTSLVKAFILVF